MSDNQNYIEFKQALDNFRSKWTIEKIQQMTLEQYAGNKDESKNNDEQSFKYDIENNKKYGEPLGGMGGYSTIFGIYQIKQKDKDQNISDKMLSDGIYKWFKDYGKTAEEAFEHTKKQILKIIEYSQSGELESITKYMLNHAQHAFMWKIAFIYQNLEKNPIKIIPYYRESTLNSYNANTLNGSDNLTRQELYNNIIQQKNIQNLKDAFDIMNEIHKTKQDNHKSDITITKEDNSMQEKERNTLLNQILYGPPGTGKTYSIKEEVNNILKSYDKEQKNSIQNLQKKYPEHKDYTLAFTTFHPAYGYEEFIEGIRPNLDDGQTSVTYKIHQGVFKELCILAKGNKSEPYFMIIDEINRGNIPKIFGELITLIEDNKRDGNPEAISVILPYSKKPFTVPKNVHIIGTMNTADKSLTALDTALRRRFIFKEMMPKPELIAKDSNGIIDGIEVRNLLTKINENIEQKFERSHHIGHAFFMNCETKQDVIDALAYKIIPLLQEYTYDDWEKMSKILFNDKDKMKNLVKSSDNTKKSIFEIIAEHSVDKHIKTM